MLSPGWVVPSVPKDFLDPELCGGWNVCLTVNLDVSKAVFIALELEPNIFSLTRAAALFKTRFSKALFSFQKKELPPKEIFLFYFIFLSSANVMDMHNFFKLKKYYHM